MQQLAKGFGKSVQELFDSMLLVLWDALFIDHVDAALAPEIQTIGPTPICSAILMRDLKDKTRMAREIVDFHHDHARKGAAA